MNKDVILPLLADVSGVAQKYKSKFMRDGQVYDKLIEELTSVADGAQYMELYRLTRESNIENMRVSFNSNPHNGQQFKLLQICLTHYSDL